MRIRAFNDETLPKLDALKALGWTAKSMAEHFGVNRNTVEEALRRIGAYARSPK